MLQEDKKGQGILTPSWVSSPQHPSASGPQSPSLVISKADTKRSGNNTPFQVHTAVRIRPLSKTERNAGSTICIRPVLTKVVPKGTNKPVSQLAVSQDIKSSATSASERSSLVCQTIMAGTENKERFVFDEIVGQRERQVDCYDRVVGNTLKQNIVTRKDTTVVVIGNRNGGKSYSIGGGFLFPTNQALTDILWWGESGGILPRAVLNLFETCNATSPNAFDIFVSFSMVTHNGQESYDLLPQKQIDENIRGRDSSWHKVKTPHDVKVLMELGAHRKRKMAKIKNGYHLFASFQIVFGETEGVYPESADPAVETSLNQSIKLSFVEVQHSEKLPLSKLPPNFGDCDGFCLRELLLSSLFGQKVVSNHFSITLDKAMKEASTAIVLACISPSSEEEEDSIEFLRLLAMVRNTTSYSTSSGPLFVQRLQNEILEESMNTSTNEKEKEEQAISKELQKIEATLRTAKEAARVVEESSQSLKRTAKKWRSHRQKLTRAGTLAAIARLAEIKKQDEVEPTSQGKVTHELQVTEKNDSQPNTTQSRLKIDSSGLQLRREKASLKAALAKERSKCIQQEAKILQLEKDIEAVTRKLVEEQVLVKKLDGIRNLLKRKSDLQGEKIFDLQQRLSLSAEPSEKEKKKEAFAETGDGDSAVAEVPCNQKTSSALVNLRDASQSQDQLLSILSDSFEEGDVFLDGDDNTATGESGFFSSGSETSQEPLSKENIIDSILANSSRRILDSSQTISKATASLLPSNQREKQPSPHQENYSKAKMIFCQCQKPLLSSRSAESIDFFLPRLRFACTCGKLRVSFKPKNINSILRPWQTGFLADSGIEDIDEFVETCTQHGRKLASTMVEWRDRKGFPHMNRQSCAAALLIWSRTCAVALKKPESH